MASDHDSMPRALMVGINTRLISIEVAEGSKWGMEDLLELKCQRSQQRAAMMAYASAPWFSERVRKLSPQLNCYPSSRRVQPHKVGDAHGQRCIIRGSQVPHAHCHRDGSWHPVFYV
ncbi:hypothetical protein NKH19_20585 [Mesorhizobium sp. M1338]|uniref:hypothetical protein n=1 Tax=unclassified Mesorhizobium TaxID=325217 RepID=UPI00333801D3